MDLYGLTIGAISTVNAMTPAVLKVSTGSAKNADFTRSPAYAAPADVMAQVQELTTKDIAHLDSLNIQSSTVAVYVSGQIQGLVRAQNKGGDLITIAEGTRAGTYLVTAVLEQWADWVKVAATLQNG